MEWCRIDDRARQMSILLKLRTTTVFVLRLLHPAKATRSSFRAHSSVIAEPWGGSGRIERPAGQMSILLKLRTTTIFVLRLLHPAKATRSPFRAHSSVTAKPCGRRGRIERPARQMSILLKLRTTTFSFCGSCTPPKRLEVHFELIQASSRILGVEAAELSDPPGKCRFCSSCEQRRFSFCGSCTPPKQLEVHF